MNGEQQPEWLSVSEAGKLRGVHRNTVAQCLDRGEIPYTVLGGRRMIRRQDIEEWQPRPQGRPRKGAPINEASPRLLVTSRGSTVQ